MEPLLEIEGHFTHGCRLSGGTGEAGGVGSCRPAQFHDTHSAKREVRYDMFVYRPVRLILTHNKIGPLFAIF